jgi:pyruvate/2-oxoglutarate dehydrogenase complex dihydrolipoamide acyltransferase (E2) component
MPTKITMPQLGESVSEGTIGRWLKQEGDMVKKDESLVEIVTDKVTAELPSPVSGRLVRILAAEDQTVKVGAEIAEIEESGGAGAPPGSGATSTAGSVTSAGGATGGGSAARAGGYNAGTPQASAPPSANGGAPLPSAPAAPRATVTAERPERVSPLARRMAQEHGVDLNAIHGTGEGGRVRKEDILAYVAQQGNGGAATAPATPTYTMPAPPVTASVGDELVTPTPARRAIAEHMVRSKHTSPHAWTAVEVDMTNLSRWLDHNKDAFRGREGYGISYQTFAIKAVVEALREHPYLNASWTPDGKILLRKAIHIGVSVALENNLIVPVIKNADTLSLAGIARAVADLVSRARARKLMPADTEGATFTVNNPGVFGTVLSNAIINQPNAAILTMDAVVKRPVVLDDAIAIRQMMFLSLSFDHRVLDGLTAAQFLGAVKRRLEAWGSEIEVY